MWSCLNGNSSNHIAPRRQNLKFLPMSVEEMCTLGWDQLDILLITGDAYVDHPAFGVPCIGRFLESHGYKVGIIAQPRWSSVEDIVRLGKPRFFVGVSSGTVDSMLNNYTANKRFRSDDMYSESGRGGMRPDNASVVYSRLVRRAFPDAVIVVGGVEASLRRLAHYDYWQNRIRPSILHDLEADLLVFGMGEHTVLAIAEELKKNSDVDDALEKLHELPGIAYLSTREKAKQLQPRLLLAAFEEVRDDKRKFARMAYLIEREANPYSGRRIVQSHGSSAVVVNPPSKPFSSAELDAIYDLPFTKEPHPCYKDKIPAAEMIKFSICSMRGCFGGCSFCGITLHQGRVIQSRSEKSILKEIEGLKKINGFKGNISDIGGPTANMYMLRCKNVDIQSKCKKFSCLHPIICPHLQSDHGPQLELLKKASKIPGVRRIFIASGLRYDLAMADEKNGMKYLEALISNHVGGHLKIAPEHLDKDVLRLMKKPEARIFEEFSVIFERFSERVGKEQYIVPYFISGFPGCTHEQMNKVHAYLLKEKWKLQQVQAFIPLPMTLASAMYWSGLDPATRKEIYVPRNKEDRLIQQALLQSHRPAHQKTLADFKNRKQKKITK